MGINKKLVTGGITMELFASVLGGNQWDVCFENIDRGTIYGLSF